MFLVGVWRCDYTLINWRVLLLLLSFFPSLPSYLSTFPNLAPLQISVYHSSLIMVEQPNQTFAATEWQQLNPGALVCACVSPHVCVHNQHACTHRVWLKDNKKSSEHCTVNQIWCWHKLCSWSTFKCSVRLTEPPSGWTHQSSYWWLFFPLFFFGVT